VRLLLQPGHERARERYVRSTKESISFFGLWYGACLRALVVDLRMTAWLGRDIRLITGHLPPDPHALAFENVRS
jgi:hypothetical protein